MFFYQNTFGTTQILGSIIKQTYNLTFNIDNHFCITLYYKFSINNDLIRGQLNFEYVNINYNNNLKQLNDAKTRNALFIHYEGNYIDSIIHWCYLDQIFYIISISDGDFSTSLPCFTNAIIFNLLKFVSANLIKII